MSALWSGLWGNLKSRIGVILLALIAFVAVLGPLFVQDPTAYVGVPLEPPSWKHWLGTTGQGQDVLAQTVVGARPTLMVAVAAGLSVVGVGAFVGGIAGYFGGRVDDALSVLINVFLLLPGLPLMVILAAWLPPGPVTLVVVLTLTGWAWNARVLRAQVSTFRQRDFVEAARMSGESDVVVLVREILPNMASLLLSSIIGATLYAIGAQVGLEFLGLGDIGQITWGTNLYWATNDAALLTGSWWTFVPTGLSVALVGFSLTLLSFGVDELTNPRLSTERHWVERLGRRPVHGQTVVQREKR